jgi:hypothetical protein
MYLNHPRIIFWDEEAIIRQKIIKPQRYKKLTHVQTGPKLDSQTNDANLEKAQKLCCRKPKRRKQ